MIIPQIKKLNIVILNLILCAAFCTKTPSPVNNGIITFSAGEVSVNGAKAVPGNEIINGDLIITGEKSTAVIQIGETGIITVKENSKLKLNLLNISTGKVRLDLVLDSGSIFNKLIKQSGSYTVKTSSVLAAVRGTSFSISSDVKGSSDIKLLSGSVEVTHNSTGKSLILAEREMISASTDSLLSSIKLPDAEKAKLEQLDTIIILPSEKVNELKNNQKTDLEIVPASVIPLITGEADFKKCDPDQKTTLAEIEKKHGQLSRIILAEGKEYIGSFRQAGDYMEIITVNGIVKVSASSVSNVVPYK